MRLVVHTAGGCLTDLAPAFSIKALPGPSGSGAYLAMLIPGDDGLLMPHAFAFWTGPRALEAAVKTVELMAEAIYDGSKCFIMDRLGTELRDSPPVPEVLQALGIQGSLQQKPAGKRGPVLVRMEMKQAVSRQDFAVYKQLEGLTVSSVEAAGSLLAIKAGTDAG